MFCFIPHRWGLGTQPRECVNRSATAHQAI
nr:MAG TPA: hypothetical protein [Caudoviricetes sp.]